MKDLNFSLLTTCLDYIIFLILSCFIEILMIYILQKQEQTKQRSLLIEIVWDIVGTRPGIMYGLCKVHVSLLHISSLFLKTEF